MWWRRPLPFKLDDAMGGADDRHFALSETHAAKIVKIQVR